MHFLEYKIIFEFLKEIKIMLLRLGAVFLSIDLFAAGSAIIFLTGGAE